MSIETMLQRHVGGLLSLWLPTMGDPAMRRLLVFEDIRRTVDGPWKSERDEIACSRLRRELDRFAEGAPVSLALDGRRKARDAFMAILAPREERVFALRVRGPAPGIRVFGCFARTDTFVATNWARRDALQGEAKSGAAWSLERRLCRTRWSQVARPYAPFEGGTIHEYLSKNVLPA